MLPESSAGTPKSMPACQEPLARVASLPKASINKAGIVLDAAYQDQETNEQPMAMQFMRKLFGRRSSGLRSRFIVRSGEATGLKCDSHAVILMSYDNVAWWFLMTAVCGLSA
jgi:hypothetical protein